LHPQFLHPPFSKITELIRFALPRKRLVQEFMFIFIIVFDPKNLRLTATNDWGVKMKLRILRHRGGGIMINTLLIAFFLVATGTAFIMWAVHEHHQANFDLARTQAYYVAQQGIMERALTSMRNRRVETLPAGREFFDPGEYHDIDNNYIGRYHDITLERISSNAEFGIFDIRYTYDLKGSGTVPLRRSNGSNEDITRSITMRAMLRTYASYMYLTKHEVTMFDEIIWFWGEDDLDGPVHSNDFIGIHGVPHFFDRFTSSAPQLAEGSDPSGWFAYDPVFDAPQVFFPETANTIRSCASGNGTFLEDDFGLMQTRLQAVPGGWLAYQWLMGTPFAFEPFDLRNGTVPKRMLLVQYRTTAPYLWKAISKYSADMLPGIITSVVLEICG